MQQHATRGRTYDRSELVSRIAELVKGMARDWEHGMVGEMGADTALYADLGFESIDLVMLLVEIEGEFRQQGIPFNTLLVRDGEYVKDLRLGELADFLVRHLVVPAVAV